MGRCEETEVITRAGLSTSTNLTHSFTILCGTWSHLNVRAPGPRLAEETAEACLTQKELESADHRTPTRYVLRALKKATKANRIHGLTSIAVPGFFNNVSRGLSALCGEKNVNDVVIYIWDSMDTTDQENSLQDIQTGKTGIIWKERDDEWKTPRSGSHQNPHTTRPATKSPRHQSQRVVEYWISTFELRSRIAFDWIH